MNGMGDIQNMGEFKGPVVFFGAAFCKQERNKGDEKNRCKKGPFVFHAKYPGLFTSRGCINLMKFRCGRGDIEDLAFGYMNVILVYSRVEIAADSRRRV
jgi:hypothetical protein